MAKAFGNDNLIKELAIRELEKRYAKERNSFLDFVILYHEEELRKPFIVDGYHEVLCDNLQLVAQGKINRLMINIPPGGGKTQLITKLFPVWVMGNVEDTQIIATGYSAQLTQSFSGEAREIYNSVTYKKVFPRRPELKKDVNTKELWKNKKGGQYLAAGVGGAITGNRAHIFIIDDPIKPYDANSDTIRDSVNNWYDSTVLSRLFNPEKNAVILIMQRVHENDLCGYLLNKQSIGGEEWVHVCIPAIGEGGDSWRSAGESYHPKRFSVKALETIRRNDPLVFETQYQQNPTSTYFQEFFPEYFRYWEELPENMRVFTVVDPAFSQSTRADYSCVMTGAFVGDKLYILEYTNARYDSAELVQAIMNHVRKWNPEKVGIESVQAQVVLYQQIKNALQVNKIFKTIVELRPRGDKEKRIRDLKGWIQAGQIVWRKDMLELEQQLKSFPKSKHDDIVDCVTFFYMMHEVRNKNRRSGANFSVQYDRCGRPIFKF